MYVILLCRRVVPDRKSIIRKSDGSKKKKRRDVSWILYSYLREVYDTMSHITWGIHNINHGIPSFPEMFLKIPISFFIVHDMASSSAYEVSDIKLRSLDSGGMSRSISNYK